MTPGCTISSLHCFYGDLQADRTIEQRGFSVNLVIQIERAPVSSTADKPAELWDVTGEWFVFHSLAT